MRIPPFRYMRWTKQQAGTRRIDLTASGVPSAPLPPIDDPAASRSMPVGDGDRPDEEAIGRRYGVPAEHVLFVPGTTLANYVLLRVLLEPDDVVLVEAPAYENLPNLVTVLGARPEPLRRRPENDFAVDPAEVEAGLAAGARAVVLTDLHNPTGVHLDPAALPAIRESARRHDATVLLDEVYRDFLPGPVGTAYDPGRPELLVTSSLTKLYGLGALRAGWILAPPPLRGRCAELVDYLTVLPPAASARAAEHVLAHAEDYRERGRALAARGRRIFEDWAGRRDDVLFVPPDGGLVVFPAFRGIEDTGPLAEWLREERETLVVPGRFFGAPDRIRLSFLPEPELLAEGLTALGEGIDRTRTSSAKAH